MSNSVDIFSSGLEIRFEGDRALRRGTVSPAIKVAPAIGTVNGGFLAMRGSNEVDFGGIAEEARGVGDEQYGWRILLCQHREDEVIAKKSDQHLWSISRLRRTPGLYQVASKAAPPRHELFRCGRET